MLLLALYKNVCDQEHLFLSHNGLFCVLLSVVVVCFSFEGEGGSGGLCVCVWILGK